MMTRISFCKFELLQFRRETLMLKERGIYTKILFYAVMYIDPLKRNIISTTG